MLIWELTKDLAGPRPPLTSWDTAMVQEAQIKALPNLVQPTMTRAPMTVLEMRIALAN